MGQSGSLISKSPQCVKTQRKQKCDDQKVVCDIIFSPALIPMIPKPWLSLESTDLLAKLREYRAVKHRSFSFKRIFKKGRSSSSQTSGVSLWWFTRYRIYGSPWSLEHNSNLVGFEEEDYAAAGE